MHPQFTQQDIAEARAMNARIGKLPKLKMETWFGRLVLNAGLRVAELAPVDMAGASREKRTVAALGREVDIRIFRPENERPKGVAVDVHGGGFTIGNARMNDATNARLARELGLAVVAVDYKLALDRPVGALVYDVEAALAWTIESGRAEFGHDRLVLMGESAGATLAASALPLIRDRGMIDRIAGALLWFGLYDFSGTRSVKAADEDTLVLHGPTLHATLDKLTPGMSKTERRDPKLSPLYARLEGLPPVLLIAGEEDPLIDDNVRMAEALTRAGVETDFLRVPASPHALNRLDTKIAEKVVAYADKWTVRRLAETASQPVA